MIRILKYIIIPCLPFFLLSQSLTAQSNIGINTTTPVRDLELYGSGNQHARIQSTYTIGGQAILELLLGGEFSAARDYKLSNSSGVFKIMTGIDNFETAGEEIWTIDLDGEVGIGEDLPTSRLHINGGEEGSNTGDGYFMIGSKTAINMIMDPNEILVRNNGAANNITLQSHDGHTEIGNGGGNTLIGDASGNLGIGTTVTSARLTIEDNEFQLKLQNANGTLNDWYIGASSDTWSVGDDQLVFSPSQSSGDAALRLQDVTDNNGTIAPVMIRSSGAQTLLLDGNEIDTKDGPLYFNLNSHEQTYFNPSGGRVGIGTDNPSTTLHIKTQADEYALRIQRGATSWEINPRPDFDYLGFIKAGWTLAHVNGVSGQWTTISDGRLKENIQPMPDVMEKVNRLNVYGYNFKHNPDGKRHIGILAQEAEIDFPEIVNSNDGHYTVAYSKLSVIILKALQEQQKEIDALEMEINQLLSSTTSKTK